MISRICCLHSHKRKIYPQSTYYWFSHFSNKQFKELLIQASAKIPKEFDGWTRIKIKSKNTQEIVKELKSEDTNFIDADFLHQNSSITKDISLLCQENLIQWKRVKEVIHKSVFQMDKQDFSRLQKYQCKNRALQTTLILIARTHPDKLRRILTQSHASRGLYQFKLLKNGIIYNVIVDDYIPCSKNLPIFAGPTDANQFYPILLEKALAKLFGGYSSIPQDPLEIMQTIYCNILTKQKLLQLKQISDINKRIQTSLSQKKMSLLVPKGQKKVQQSGINPGEIYHIINTHQIHLQTEQVILYQILSQSKLSSWNGPFRIIDPQWKKVNHQHKQMVFANMQNNCSFCIPDHQINRFFHQLIIYDDKEALNIDWIVNFSQNGYPSFSKFSIPSSDSISIKISTSQAIQQRVILGKKIGQNSYRYIGGQFEQNSKYLELNREIEGGDYIIGVVQQWIDKKEGDYVINLSSTNRTQLTLETKYIHNFLESIFTNHCQQNNTQKKGVYYSGLSEAGIGYLRIALNDKKACKVQINHNKIRQSYWQVLQPFEEMKEAVITSDTLIGMQMITKLPEEVCSFPIEAFHIDLS